MTCLRYARERGTYNIILAVAINDHYFDHTLTTVHFAEISILHMLIDSRGILNINMCFMHRLIYSILNVAAEFAESRTNTDVLFLQEVGLATESQQSPAQEV